MPKPKILFISDNPRFNYVGQAIVTRHVMAGLVERGYEVVVGGFSVPQHSQQDILEPLPYDVHVIKRWEKPHMQRLLKEQKPDVIILSHDAFLFPWLDSLKAEFPKVKFVGWFTIDGEPLYHGWHTVFDACDFVVSPTKYGENLIINTWPQTDTCVIPYGVTDDVYKPIEDRDRVVQELADKGVHVSWDENTCVYIFWGHNQSKKNIPAIYDAWKEAKMSEKNALLVLILHSHVEQYYGWKYLGDWDWQNEIDQSDNSISIVDGSYLDCILGRIVSLCNFVVFPSIGEGFGLPVIESMRAGLIPITTNYAGPTDFCVNGYNSFLVDGAMTAGVFNVRRMLVDPKTLAHYMSNTYDIWENRDNEDSDLHSLYYRMSENAVEDSQVFTWENCVNGWDNLLSLIVSDSYRPQWKFKKLIVE